jgi:hypothetical protein
MVAAAAWLWQRSGGSKAAAAVWWRQRGSGGS